VTHESGREGEEAVSCIVDDDLGTELPTPVLEALLRCADRMVRAVGLAEGGGALELSLRLTGDPEMRALNRQYRQKDRATDVLAFPQREGDGAQLAGAELGDVVISVSTAARQAKGTLLSELCHLLAHGLCHLLGYDHRDDDEEAVMNARAKALLEVGLADDPVRAA